MAFLTLQKWGHVGAQRKRVIHYGYRLLYEAIFAIAY